MKKLFLAIFIFSIFFTTNYAQPYRLGLQFNDEEYATVPMKAPLVRSLYSLPASASLKAYTPLPQSQGDYGTCVGWSSTYAALTISKAIQNNLTSQDVITQSAFSPGFIYNLIKDNGDYNCEWGASISDACDILKTRGAPKKSDFDISCVNVVPNTLYGKASANKIDDYAKLFDTYDNNTFKIQATKKSISENKPVVIGMKCPDSFYDAVGCWEPTEDFNRNFGGHAMCVIGYDDNKYGGAFEIQNSWGTDWGNEGYIWITYEDFANFTKYAYELIDASAPNVNTYDLSGKVRFLLAAGSEMKATLYGTTYNINQPYSSGTQFRLYISNNEPAFVYAIGSDNTGKIFQIFPHDQGISPALTYKQNEVPIPDEDHYIQMDNTVGTDYLCVLYCKKPIDFITIVRKIEQQTGTFSQKIKKALMQDLVATADVEFATNEISFKAKSNGKSIVALIVETQHID